MNRKELYVYFMIYHYQRKQESKKFIPVKEEFEKRKKTAVKKIKVNKKWFQQNYDKINIKHNIKEQFNLGNMSAGEIYSKYLGEKKLDFNRNLYDIINSVYIDEKIPKRIVELD